jgi:hypothetical protein
VNSILLETSKIFFLIKHLELYYSLLHCHLVYALEVWSTASPSILQPLITKHKAAIGILANRKYKDHTEPLFQELSILPLPDLILATKLKFFTLTNEIIYQIFFLILGIPLDKLILNITPNSIMTRNTSYSDTELNKLLECH